MEVAQSELLAKLQQRAAGTYEKAKATEAKAGGRSLPGNLKNAVGRITAMKLGESEKGNLYVYIYGTTISPDEHYGIPCGWLIGLWDDEYNSFEQGFEELIATLKLLGFSDAIEGVDEPEFFRSVLPSIIDTMGEDKPYFLFNTSNRARKDGTYRIFVQGLPPADFEPPQRAQGESQHEGYKAPSQKGSPQKQAPQKQAPPAKSPPSAKAPPKKKGPPKKAAAFEVGQEVTVTVDGDPFPGATIVKIEGNIVSVDWGDQDIREFPMSAISQSTPAPVPVGFVAGNRVQTEPSYFGDGTSYPGTVKSVNGEMATVTFDLDGEDRDVELNKLLPALPRE